MKPTSEIEIDLEGRLAKLGWGERARAVAIDPELEIWLWSDSPHVDSVLGWDASRPDLRKWMVDQGLLTAGAVKPAHPKEAMDAVLRATRGKASASIFAEAARKVGLDRCQDRSFLRFRQILRDWFPAGQ